MEWSSLIKNEKELSSLQLDKPDITYQVWVLGSMFASISDGLWRIKVTLDKEKEGGDLSDLIGNITNLFDNFRYLCKRLKEDTTGVLSDIAEIENSIEHFFEEDKESVIITKTDFIHQEIKKWHNQILFELRAKSIHLCNIFSCSFGLKNLRTKLMYDINSNDVEKFINISLENLEALEKGDKILTSPNLEITPQNLKIIKFGLNGIRMQLPELKESAKKSPDESKDKMNKRFKMWENFILDIKNPSDYLSRKRRLLNKIVPFVVCYYIVAIPIVLVLELELLPNSQPQWNSKLFITLITFSLGLIPLVIAFLRWVYVGIKNHLIISSFKFNASVFNVD